MFYSAFVTYSYLIIKNPVYHQVCYAILVFTVVFRSVYLVRTLPNALTYEKKTMTRLLWISASSFGGAFVVWNIDNQFCGSLHNLRDVIGMPLAALSEVYVHLLVESCS